MAVCLVFCLSACGGGGGGGGGSDDPSGGGNNGGGNGGSGEAVIPASDDYLCFTANVDGCSISTTVAYSLTTTPTLEYSTDKENWLPFIINSTSVDLPNNGDKVYIRATGSNATFSETSSKWIKFVISGSVSASGNIMSLLDKNCGGNSVPEWAFYRLFYGNSTLTTAPKLPATTLAERCYAYMFYECDALTTAPELPATTLAERCYTSMFEDCSSLTTAPELPATTLADYCYEDMFFGCYALTTAPELPATTLAMGCYSFMFSHCHSLTTAPELPAIELETGCYAWMFAECINLNSITVHFGDWDNAFTSNWVYGVPSGGTFICPAGLPEEYGDSRIPTGWTVQHPSTP